MPSYHDREVPSRQGSGLSSCSSRIADVYLALEISQDPKDTKRRVQRLQSLCEWYFSLYSPISISISIPNAPTCSTFSFKQAVRFSLNLKTYQIPIVEHRRPMFPLLCAMPRGTAQRGIAAKNSLENEGLGKLWRSSLLQVNKLAWSIIPCPYQFSTHHSSVNIQVTESSVG